MTLSDLLTPYAFAGHAGLVRDGLTREQAFDEIALEAATPEVQAVIQELQCTSEGRQVLAQIERYWHAEGLPAPWDNVLELPSTTKDVDG